MYFPSNSKTWSAVFADPLLKKRYFWVPMLLLFVVMWVPGERASEYVALLDELVNVMSMVVPSISAWAAHSTQPKNTALLFSICWLLIPYYAYIVGRNKMYEANMISVWVVAGKRRHLYPLILLTMAFCLAFLFYKYNLPEDLNCSQLCFHKSMFLQFALGVAWSIGIAYLVACVYWWLRNFSRIHF